MHTVHVKIQACLALITFTASFTAGTASCTHCFYKNVRNNLTFSWPLTKLSRWRLSLFSGLPSNELRFEVKCYLPNHVLSCVLQVYLIPCVELCHVNVCLQVIFSQKLCFAKFTFIPKQNISKPWHTCLPTIGIFRFTPQKHLKNKIPYT